MIWSQQQCSDGIPPLTPGLRCLGTSKAACGRAARGDGEARVVLPLWAALASAPMPPVEDTAAGPQTPLHAADEDASCASEDCTPVGCTSVDEPALATANSPECASGMTPLIMASACSR